MAVGSTSGGVDTPKAESARATEQIHDVVIGVLLGLGDDGAPLVAFPGNPEEAALKARSTAHLQKKDAGREVALMFEGGDPYLPLVIGVVQHPKSFLDAAGLTSTAEIDGERVVLSAEREIVLRCGKASITLTKAGKVLIRGDYVLSRSSGVNRLKGGVVHIN